MKLVFDIEANGLRPTVIWCICAVDVDTGETYEWRFDNDPAFSEFREFAKSVDLWIGHNILGYDVPVVNKLLGYTIDPAKTVDTFVVSRLTHYTGFNGHGLDEIGSVLGYRKTHFDDWDKLTDEMVEYCHNDVKVSLAVYHRFDKVLSDPEWAEAIRCEQNMSSICRDMHDNGFYFNRPLAEEVHGQILSRREELEAVFQEVWPPELTHVNTIKYRTTLDGVEYSNVSQAKAKYPKWELVGSELYLYDYTTFNPASSKDRVEKLWDAGWRPTEKTKTAYQFDLKAKPGELWGKTRLNKEQWQEKKEYFAYYGWTVSDENLETLPEDAPEGARALAEWLCLNGREKALSERLRECEDDSRIRSSFWHIGAWTHRTSTSSPNVQNLSSPFRKKPRNPVEVVKSLYDAKMREMFCVDEGFLVGTDAESIQLRILAHYLRNDDYVHAIVSGKKADEADIHNVNRRALGLDHLTRDHAKTFIYAWLLGAGVAKVARILGCSMAAAKTAVDSFIANTKGLGELKRGRIQRDARRRYFKGLDGRKVVQPDAYLMLAGYLQNGEAVVMKHANILWRQWAEEEKIKFKQVNLVHDEWQTQVIGSMDAAERLGYLQCESLTEVGKRLNVYCPLSGETKIGVNWLETH